MTCWSPQILHEARHKRATRTERPEPTDPCWEHGTQRSDAEEKHQQQFYDPRVSFFRVVTDNNA
jgi:hypothetical protein